MSEKQSVLLSCGAAILVMVVIHGGKFLIKEMLKRQPSSIIVVKPEEKNFKFIYKFQNKIFEHVAKAETREQAFKQSAKECFHYYTQGKYPGEERGLDIIDTCANPKSSQ